MVLLLCLRVRTIVISPQLDAEFCLVEQLHHSTEFLHARLLCIHEVSLQHLLQAALGVPAPRLLEGVDQLRTQTQHDAESVVLCRAVLQFLAQELQTPLGEISCQKNEL